MADPITAESLATIIAEQLEVRDDIATAEVVEVLPGAGGVVSGMVVTQGGAYFAFAVTPA